MSTKRKKRITKQIRVDVDAHGRLRHAAKRNGTVISRIASKLCRKHLPRPPKEKKRLWI